MKRIIPKPIKVKIAFLKDFYTRDIIFLAGSLLIIGATAFSNIAGNWVLMVIEATLCCCLFLFKTDDRLYYEIFIYCRYLFSKKKFAGNEQTAMESIQNDVIKFKGGYYAGVLKVSSMEFFLLRDEIQNKLIDTFAAIYKNLAVGQKISLVKLDRPVILDKFVAELQTKLDNVKSTSAQGKAMKEVLQDRKETLEKINKIDNCCYYNAFYVVLYDENLGNLNAALNADIKELTDGGIEVERISKAELVGFAKRTITQIFDEREIEYSDEMSLDDVLTPGEIKFSAKVTEVDGINETTFVINRYPLETFNAWATALCNIDYSKVIITATPIPTDKAMKQLDRSAAEIEEQYTKTGKVSKRSESELHYASMKYLVEEIGNNNEVMLDVCASVTCYDYEKKGGAFRKNMKKTINKLGFRTSSMVSRQAEAYRLSTLNNSLNKAQVFTQGIHSSSLSAAFPFVSTQILEPNGIMVGENSAPVIIDFFKRGDMYKNSNVVVLGSVGGGKSFFAKTFFTNLIADDVHLFVLDPEAEYNILADNMGGQVIDMGAGGNIINPFAVLTDVADDSDTQGNLLLAHLTFLEEFFRTTLDGLGSENLELVLSLLPELYEEKGITTKTDLKKYVAENKEFPIFDDLLKLIREKQKKAKNLEKANLKVIDTFLKKFAKNGRYSFLWNGQTNLQANADFIVFNFQTLLANANKTIAAAQMLLLTQYLNNELIHNYNKIKRGASVKPIVIATDEAHVFIDPNNPVALRFMKNTAKRCRKYMGMQVVMTQSVNDFLGGVDLERESKAVITECQYTFVFPLNASSAADFLKLYDKLDITQDEANEIMDNPRGTAFFVAHQRNRTSFRVMASDKVRSLFETQRTAENQPIEEEPLAEPTATEQEMAPEESEVIAPEEGNQDATAS